MQMSPVIAVHLTAALLALATGPVALWARQGATQRPRLHRAAGYAWVTLMLVTAVSAIFIRDRVLPNIAGYTPIHLLIPATFIGLWRAFFHLFRGDIAGHRRLMQIVYYSACVVPAAFTLLPSRYLGNLVWREWLGVLPPAGPLQAAAAPVVRHGPTLMQIVAGTPMWVWGLAAGLLALGLSQVRSREVGLPRTALTPLAMVGLAAWGLYDAFGHPAGAPAAAAFAPVLVAWFAAAALPFLFVLRRPLPAATRYHAATRSFFVPGSWLPMALIAGIFATKYVVGVLLVLHPQLRADAAFALCVAVLYGLFNGVFAGRGLRLLRLAFQPQVAAPRPAHA
jgi:uncharacterized membrane protein